VPVPDPQPPFAVGLQNVAFGTTHELVPDNCPAPPPPLPKTLGAAAPSCWLDLYCCGVCAWALVDSSVTTINKLSLRITITRSLYEVDEIKKDAWASLPMKAIHPGKPPF
jgi:hypothetical protein